MNFVPLLTFQALLTSGSRARPSLCDETTVPLHLFSFSGGARILEQRRRCANAWNAWYYPLRDKDHNGKANHIAALTLIPPNLVLLFDYLEGRDVHGNAETIILLDTSSHVQATTLRQHSHTTCGLASDNVPVCYLLAISPGQLLREVYACRKGRLKNIAV